MEWDVYGFLRDCCFASTSKASVIGIDFDSDLNGWTYIAVNPATIGWEFSVAEDTQVDGLGFWDLDAWYAPTTVGLWDTSGTLLGSVHTTSVSDPAVTKSDTGLGSGWGSWDFMDFDYALTPGNYVLGASGDGWHHIFNTEGGRTTTNLLTFVNLRNNSDHENTYPNCAYLHYDAFFGPNIRFATPIPEPSPLGLLGFGLAGLVIA